MKKAIKGLQNIGQDWRVDTNSDDSPMGAGRIPQNISKMLVECDQCSMFPPGKLHDPLVRSADHFGFIGVDNVKVHAPQKSPNSRGHVLIKEELRHQAGLSKGMYSASRINPAA